MYGGLEKIRAPVGQEVPFLKACVLAAFLGMGLLPPNLSSLCAQPAPKHSFLNRGRTSVAWVMHF